MQQNIRLIRMQSGPDVISELDYVDETFVNLKNPIAIAFVPRGGKTILVMESWIPSSILVQNEVIIRITDIVFSNEILPLVLESYLDMVQKILGSNGSSIKVIDEPIDMDQMDIHILEELDMEGETLQ